MEYIGIYLDVFKIYFYSEFYIYYSYNAIYDRLYDFYPLCIILLRISLHELFINN